MSATFDELISSRQEPDGAWVLDVPDRWQQGRGAFGGFVLASLVRAMERACGDGSRSLRALSATIAAPVLAQRSVIDASVLRAGAGLTAVTSTLSQEGAPLAHAIGTFAKDRQLDFVGWRELAPPELGDWRAADVVPVGPPVGPAFAPQFEFRPLVGFPMGGGAPRTEGWVRAKNPGARRGAAYVTALVDAWWPCALVVMESPRPMATIAFSLELVGDLEGLDPFAPFFHRAYSPVCVGGYAQETRELWGYDGRLVAVNHQTFAVIK
ncbi:MAG: thioesterase family protein [Polyangiales bacterium]